jgi:hypothetical protein
VCEIVLGIVCGLEWGIGLGIVWEIAQGSELATRTSNPHEFFTFQNFKGIIEYAKNESD